MRRFRSFRVPSALLADLDVGALPPGCWCLLEEGRLEDRKEIGTG